jgi:hypothetical protein
MKTLVIRMMVGILYSDAAAKPRYFFPPVETLMKPPDRSVSGLVWKHKRVFYSRD